MSSNVRPVPEGFHTITPYLIVRDAPKAIEFYKKAFEAQEIGRSIGPDGKSILHANLKIGDSIIMLSDEFPDMNCHSPQSLGGSSVTIHMYVDDVDSAFAKAISSGATILMPLIDTFWGDRYGQVLDPFGHRWSLATRKLDLSKEEVERAGKAFFLNMQSEIKD
jgi:uncharacterized glyoxalase superfamily protein PhnB